nr:uncharacterized protein LOC129386445 [Dermacentor andersoni]
MQCASSLVLETCRGAKGREFRSLYYYDFIAMQGKHLLMCFVLVVDAATRNTHYFSCQGRERQCPSDRRPNCLLKNGQPYFQCSLKNRTCEDAWYRACAEFTVFICCDRRTYCDCRCGTSRKCIH